MIFSCYIPLGEKIDSVLFVSDNKIKLECNITNPTKEELISMGSLHGKVDYTYECRDRLVRLKVFPIICDVDSVGVEGVNDPWGKYYVCTKFTIVIKTSKTEEFKVSNLRKRDIEEYVWNLKHTKRIKNREDVESDLKEKIENILDNSISVDSTHINSKSNWSVPFYEYVVITSKELIKSFEPLVTWKRRKGLNAGVVAIEDILSDNAEPLTTEYYAKAIKLKQYLKASYEAGIGQYVLLGGNDKIIPIINKKNFPSDLYFSVLNTDKINDQNSTSMMQMGDFVSILYVGRLLCENEKDVNTWIRKQILYEQNPGNGDFSYLNKMLVTRSDEPGKRDNDTISEKYFNITELKESEEVDENGTPVFPTGVDVINEMNKNYGVMTNFNHGGPYSYQVSTKGDNSECKGIKCKYSVFSTNDADIISNGMSHIEEGNGFDNLTNYDYPSVMYSVSCENMPFDNYNGYRDNGLKNLGEAFTVVSEGGGIAYLGNTRSSWVVNDVMRVDFFEIAGLRYEEDEYVQLGIIEHLSKCEGFHRNNSRHIEAIYCHNLSGCPETNLWMGIPQKFTDVKITKADGTVAVTLPADQISNKTDVHITSAEDGGISYQKSARFSKDKTVLTFTDVPEDYVLVITQPRHVPYIFSSVGCYIQNETFASDMSYDCDRIVAGENVTDTKEQGPVVVEKGAKLTLTAKDKTVLKGGFQVKLGGSLEVK